MSLLIDRTELTPSISCVMPAFNEAGAFLHNIFFPQLMQPNANGKIVLFGSYPKDIDKKRVVWEKVSKREPEISWILDKNGQLKKENFDMSDAATAVIGYVNMIKSEKSGN